MTSNREEMEVHKVTYFQGLVHTGKAQSYLFSRTCTYRQSTKLPIFKDLYIQAKHKVTYFQGLVHTGKAQSYLFSRTCTYRQSTKLPIFKDLYIQAKHKVSSLFTQL